MYLLGLNIMHYQGKNIAYINYVVVIMNDKHKYYSKTSQKHDNMILS